MIKKIIIIFIIFFSFFNISFSEWENTKEAKDTAEKKVNKKAKIVSEAQKSYNRAKIEGNNEKAKEISWNLKNLKKELNDEVIKYKQAKTNYDNSEESKDDFSSIWFNLSVWDLFPWTRYTDKNSSVTEKANMFFADIIQKLMIWLGSLALLIITIWAWFMIFYHWEDSLLTKWKSIFSAWIISLIIALMSFYIIEFVKFLIG
jgi:ABC-type multidrug transport system fused ATPase/permease subunit